ncbi:NlpC/P60 family protein [Phytohabitans sp. ZYX-F-186]|uniref:NlpC/P60 family protein n=1 Tax=Phytohabitans maris TaxID=3071409 RepID=A0ABU0ZLA7_9ACTN|nr:NlpC/P60 family protein [Phytohabitans sp. ZYX-F-186]MDQ7907828.1 NlpC/P60 family protein [Phytohabitans sp. ZYX-F-186]
MSSARKLLRALVLVGLGIGLTVPAAAAQAEPSPSELTEQINKASTELEKVVESYNKLNEQLKQTKTASAALAAKMGPLEAQLAKADAEVGTMAAVAYRTGQVGTASALLDGSGSLADRLGVLDQLARDRKRQLEGFTATERQYTEEKAKLEATQAKQTAQLKELAAGKKKIEAELDKLYEMREKAYGSATSSSGGYTGSIPSISGKAGVAVRFAYNAIGTPYVWAAEGPDGYDCSGLTLAAWRAAGKTLPHNAAMQWDVVAHIGRGSLQAGDLVFYSGLGHVAIYVGGGKVIHAPTFGESVKLASVDMMSPYGYGRVR